MQFSLTKEKILNKNTLFSIYFIFFILLNILDFLGKLSADLDFFKKILSWTLIGVLFYQISFTNIFIGKKLPKYDIAYIIGFFILLIPKILSHYIKGVEVNSFLIFNSTITVLTYILNNYLDFLGSVFLGIIILLLINFILLSNHSIELKSFIGSLNLKSTFGHRITTHVALFFLVFFFAFVIAPFFLEWFALSVDALILVVGLIYYIIVFIHKYRDGGKISNFLKTVYNSGNSFFKELISTFSNKKTFFIGVSFLLAVHLIVDIGVYMVPYLFGTSSPLYFSELDSDERDHIPIFNVFDFQYSQSSTEITTIFSSENSSNIGLKIIQFLFVLLLYIASYFYFFILLCFPFYYIYKRIKNQLITLPKYIIIFIIAMSLFYLLSQDFFMPTISMPISIGTTQSIGVEGVDIYTNPIFNENMSLTSVDFSDTISLLIFFILLFFLFVVIKFEKYKQIFTHITYGIFLLFFVIYIMLFYIDLNTGVWNQNLNTSKITSSSNYDSYHAYTNENKTKQSTYETSKVELVSDLIVTGEIYTTKDDITFFYGTYELKNITSDILKQNTNIGFAKKEEYIYINMNYMENILEKSIRNEVLLQSYIDGKRFAEEKIKEDLRDETIQKTFKNFISYIAFFFSTVFYVIGIVVFSIHYIKTLYRRELR
jgi:hypothetical protein